jgi:hypothetical protein
MLNFLATGSFALSSTFLFFSILIPLLGGFLRGGRGAPLLRIPVVPLNTMVLASSD